MNLEKAISRFLFWMFAVSMFSLAFSVFGKNIKPKFFRINDNRYVEMIHGRFRILFDTHYGGAPTTWEIDNGTTSVISPHPGEAFQLTYDTGQDGTQGSANGILENRISRVIDSRPIRHYRDYYLKERLPYRWPHGAHYYEVREPIPDFWASHLEEDDAIPTLTRGVSQRNWVTRYTAHLHGKDEQEFLVPEIPIWYKGSNERTLGIIFEGNALKAPRSYPWNQRLRPIQEGRFAIKLRISLKDSSDDAFAGILFRRKIIAYTDVLVHLDHAYKSPGYSLNVNKRGILEIRRSDGSGNQALVWGVGLTEKEQERLNKYGLLLELRTNNFNQKIVQVWVEGKLRGTYVDDNVILGPYIGLVASTAPGTSVKFFDREVFDVGLEFVSRVSGLPDGSIETDMIVQNAPGVTRPHRFYRMNTVAFLNTPADSSLNSVWTETDGGRQRHVLNKDTLIKSTHIKLEEGSRFWAGNEEGTQGIYAIPIEATVDHRPSRGAVVSYGVSFEDPDHHVTSGYLHLNALRPDLRGSITVPAKHIRLRVKWMPPDDIPPLYQIKSSRSPKCMAIRGNSHKNGALIHQWGCASDMLFSVISYPQGGVQLRSNQSKKCLYVDSNERDGALRQWDCNDKRRSKSMTFELLPQGGFSYLIQSLSSNKCITIRGNNFVDNGVPLNQYDCFPDMQWELLEQPAP